MLDTTSNIIPDISISEISTVVNILPASDLPILSDTSSESQPTGTGNQNSENRINWNRTNALTENNAYNRIIYQSFKDPEDRGYESDYTDKTSSKVNELVDVVSEYHWSIDSMKFGNGKIAFVPHCYAIEYQ